MKSLRLSLPKRQRGATLAFSIVTLLRPSVTLSHTMPAAASVPCFCLQHCTKPLHKKLETWTRGWLLLAAPTWGLFRVPGWQSWGRGRGGQLHSSREQGTSRRKAFSAFHYLMCTANTGKHTGHRLPWETKTRPSQFPCLLSSPHPWAPPACMPMHNCIADSLCSAVTGRFSWWPEASLPHIREKSVMVAF